MAKNEFRFEFETWENENDLDALDYHLLLKAKEAAKNAHAPYSGFNVGAAIRLDDGTIVLGANQENASYPAGVCAEMVAITHVGSNYPDNKIDTIAITTQSLKHKTDIPAAPCGLCRQSLLEYESKQKKPIQVLLQGQVGQVIKIYAVADLLPLGFDSSFLDTQ